MFFEEYPIILLLVIIAVVEGWLRVREPLFRLFTKEPDKQPKNTPRA